MKLKLDENLAVTLRPRLAELGHDVDTVADEGLLAQPDTAVAEAARAEERMLFTLDVGFADLRRHPPGAHPGIVLFRPKRLGPTSVNDLVERFVRASDLEGLAGAIVVVESDGVRARHPHEESP